MSMIYSLTPGPSHQGCQHGSSCIDMSHSYLHPDWVACLGSRGTARTFGDRMEGLRRQRG